jgi:hypothetical protein
MLYFNAHGQAICDSFEFIRVEACDDTNYHDSCFFRKYNIYFTEVDTNADLSDFFVNNIQVSAIFSGDGFIDRNLSTVNDGGDFWSVIQTSLNTISFVPQAGCVSSLNRYDIPIGDCSSPFIEVYIIAPPGGNPQLDEVQITAFSTYPCDDDFCIFSD